MTDLPTTDDDRMPQCGSCRFYVAEDDQADVPSGEMIGTCHRYPPVDHPYLGSPGTPTAFPQFPAVMDNEWCGEHVAAKTVVIPAPAGTVQHEPHRPCAACLHGLAMHADGTGDCKSFASDSCCSCTAFVP